LHTIIAIIIKEKIKVTLQSGKQIIE